MKKQRTIICNGDSWVFGSEILDPELEKKRQRGQHITELDYHENNDKYRCSRIFSTYMAEIEDAISINISWPADDNTSILHRTIDYVTCNYLSQNKSVDDLLLIVGWSSPERNSFWYDDGKLSMHFRLWPNIQHFESDLQKKFWDIYTRCIWNPQEYIRRYVHTVLNFQNWCCANDIKWLCFNSFQQIKRTDINEWIDLDVRTEIQSLMNTFGGYHSHSSVNNNNREYNQYNLMSLWDSVDPIRFYKKDMTNNTFKSYITQHNRANPFNGWHPSPESHRMWAEELWRYIRENNLD